MGPFAMTIDIGSRRSLNTNIFAMQMHLEVSGDAMFVEGEHTVKVVERLQQIQTVELLAGAKK